MLKKRLIQANKALSDTYQIEENYLDDKAKSWLGKYFQNKTYFRKYLPFALFLIVLTLLENIVSAITGYSYTYNLVSSFASSDTAFYYAIVIIVIVEVGKQIVNHNFFKIWKKDGLSEAWGVGIVALGLLIVSLWFSWHGAQAVVVENSHAPTLINTDSIRSYYDTQIHTIDESIVFLRAEHQKQASWTTINKTIPSLQKDKQALSQQRDQSLATAQSKNDKIDLNASTKIALNATQVQWIAIIFNLITLAIYYFISRFLFKSGINYDLLSGTVSTQDDTQNTATKNPMPSNPIGFQFSSKPKPEQSPEHFSEQDPKVFKRLSEQDLNTFPEQFLEQKPEHFLEQSPEQKTKTKAYIIKDENTIEHISERTGETIPYTKQQVKGMVSKYQKRVKEKCNAKALANRKTKLAYWQERLLEFDD